MSSKKRSINVDFSTCKWAVSDEEALTLIPNKGLINDILLEYANMTDAPIIFHFAGLFTTAITALAQCELIVGNDPTKAHRVPLVMWSVVVAESADRKSSAIDRPMQSLRRVMPDRLFPADGSVEGWQAALMEQPNALQYRDEFSSLIDMGQKSHMANMKSWLLEAWTGSDIVRRTLSNKEQICKRPRLSLIGCIPPNIFSVKVTKSDWSSGFLPRFVFWGGRRESWLDRPYGSESGKYTKWLDTIAAKSNGVIQITDKAAEVINNWMYEEIELKRQESHPDLDSTYQRLQDTGYKLAAVVEMFKATKPIVMGTPTQIVQVTEESVTSILPILKTLKNTIAYIYATASTSREKGDEDIIVRYLLTGQKYTITKLSSLTGFSQYKVRRALEVFFDIGAVSKAKLVPEGGRPVGRPMFEYSITPNYSNQK